MNTSKAAQEARNLGLKQTKAANTAMENLQMAIHYEEENFQAMLDEIHKQGHMPTEDQINKLDRKAGYLNGMIFALSVIEEAEKNA